MMISAPKMSDDFCEKIARNAAMAPYTPITGYAGPAKEQSFSHSVSRVLLNTP